MVIFSTSEHETSHESSLFIPHVGGGGGGGGGDLSHLENYDGQQPKCSCIKLDGNLSNYLKNGLRVKL